MIGQTNLKGVIDTLIENNTFPRFSILVGPEGSGKKTIAHYISTKLNMSEYMSGISVDDVRNINKQAVLINMPILYVIADADKMSNAAKNALLKIAEEPPNLVYIVLTLTNVNNTLQTIKSRSSVFYMDPYTLNDIDEYYHNMFPSYADERKIVGEICETPGEVNTVVSMGAVAFYEYAEKVVDNVATVSGSNAFKIASKLKFKEADEDKYDLKLFWKAFMSICASRLQEDTMRYAKGIQVTSKYLQDLRIVGINKQNTFDLWLLDIRKEWM